ncbi:MAG: hypothetical protein HXY45_09315 [Syntrophaceae bacterium]|nr:hypothetical protein [Syntrophaceae bacterium]
MGLKPAPSIFRRQRTGSFVASVQDTDDVTSYGPEIVTVTKLLPGMYRYSVHNFSGQSSFKMENSGCVVNVVIPKSGIIRRYDIPTSNPTNGNLRVVFELTVDNAGDTTLTGINQFKETNPPGESVE